MDPVLVVVIAAAFGYGAVLAGWNALLRRWRLTGPQAPPRELLGRGEHLARRWLKALLAFDALVLVPALGVSLLLAVSAGAIEPYFIVLALAGLSLFVAPVPRLLRRVRALESFRLAGLPEPALAATTGHASLDAVLRQPVPVSRVTAGVIVVSSVTCIFVPELGHLFEKQNDALRDGELWRLFTVALVHGGVVHLFFNVSVFLDVAGLIERLTGALRMSAIFWIGTAAATLASAAAMPYPSVGASGGVFALMGALWAVAFRHRQELPPPVRSRFLRSTATVIGLNVLIGFSIPHVDWAAHLGGLAAGVLMGLALGLGPAARAALARPAASGAGPWVR